MKVAPLYHQLAREGWCDARIVHTGQPYDPKAYAAVCQRERPAAVGVVGDVNATAACALVHSGNALVSTKLYFAGTPLTTPGG